MSDKDDKKIIIKFILHHVLMMIVILIIVFAVAYTYYSLQAKGRGNIKMPISEQVRGAAHPLPDFIVDKIKPDELGELKP